MAEPGTLRKQLSEVSAQGADDAATCCPPLPCPALPAPPHRHASCRSRTTLRPAWPTSTRALWCTATCRPGTSCSSLTPSCRPATRQAIYRSYCFALPCPCPELAPSWCAREALPLARAWATARVSRNKNRLYLVRCLEGCGTGGSKAQAVWAAHPHNTSSTPLYLHAPGVPPSCRCYVP